MIAGITSLDYAISQALNQVAQRTHALDEFLEFIAVTHPVKGGLMMLAVWWLWFHRTDKSDDRRTAILCTLVGVTSAVFFTKVVTAITPFRPRPLFNAGLHLQIPFGVESPYLDRLSSFPSDHASLFIGLAFGFFYVSRRLGWATLTYSLLFICLPRVFLGFHYLSDVIAGGAIGVASVFVMQRAAITGKVRRLGMNWLRLHPGSFYCCLFVGTYQIVNQFDEARAAAHMLLALAKSNFTIA